MVRLFAAALLIIIPAVLALPEEKPEKQGRSLPVPVGQALTASGATGLNYGNTQASNENHNKKNFGLNYSSDQGSSSNFDQTGLQAAAAGSIAQAQVPQYPGYPYQYPPYPSYYPTYQYPPQPIYPQYPQYQYQGVGLPNLGVGSNVNLPGGVAANSGGVVKGAHGY